MGVDPLPGGGPFVHTCDDDFGTFSTATSVANERSLESKMLFRCAASPLRPPKVVHIVAMVGSLYLVDLRVPANVWAPGNQE